MKLYDCLVKGYPGMKDHNCAEKILYGANIAYGLGLDKEALKLAAGFGRGVGDYRLCGAICGGVMAFSSMYVKDRAHESERIAELTTRLIREAEAKFGSSECRELREKYRTPERGCADLILETAKLIDSIVESEPR